MIPAARTVRWADWSGAERGLEHCELRPSPAGLEVAGLVLGSDETGPFALHYRLAVDGAWRLREAVVTSAAGIVLTLVCVDGSWTIDGAPAPGLAGCTDIDISATPFTNTLPIRRLGLVPGATAEIAVAYVAAPDLAVSASRQRYSGLPANLFRFESLDSGFTADLPVDRDGLVLDYPGLFRRVAPLSSIFR